MIANVIDGRARDLGGFTVRRVLPAPTRRQVGPFTFFDEMGPRVLAPGEGLDIRPHPHVGLATVTYLYEGEILHRDSLGSAQPIRPGDINWMTAGCGIAHSERTTPEIRRTGSRVHGLQLWVALPAKDEEIAPSFRHYPGVTLPEVEREGVQARVLAGAVYGATSPVETSSPLFFVDARMVPGSRLPLPDGFGERAVYVVAGRLRVGTEVVDPGRMLVFTEEAAVELEAEGSTRIALLGGAPLEESRFLWWNFVSSRPERVEQAAADWRAGRFPKVPGDEVEFTPAPDDGPRFP